MNRVAPFALWIGHGGEAGELTRLYENGVEAVVSLAVEEPPDRSPRDLIACRVPLVDGAGNRTERLALAVQTVATLLAAGVPTLVCCGAGMSRAPAVAAAALARVHGDTPAHWLERVTRHHPSDVSAGLWADLVALADDTLGPFAKAVNPAGLPDASS